MSPKGKQLTLSDRIAIETGLMAQDPLKKIAAILGKQHNHHFSGDKKQ